MHPSSSSPYVSQLCFPPPPPLPLPLYLLHSSLSLISASHMCVGRAPSTGCSLALDCTFSPLYLLLYIERKLMQHTELTAGTLTLALPWMPFFLRGHYLMQFGSKAKSATRILLPHILCLHVLNTSSTWASRQAHSHNTQWEALNSCCWWRRHSCWWHPLAWTEALTQAIDAFRIQFLRGSQSSLGSSGLNHLSLLQFLGPVSQSSSFGFYLAQAHSSEKWKEQACLTRVA